MLLSYMFQSSDIFHQRSSCPINFFREGSIRAVVNNIFQNTNLTDDEVHKILNISVNDGSLGNVTLEGELPFHIQFWRPKRELF